MTFFSFIFGAVVTYIVIKKLFPWDVRDCPSCYSKIPKKATICKYCQSKVEAHNDTDDLGYYVSPILTYPENKVALSKKLSERTGSSLRKAKNALDETGGDFEAAEGLLLLNKAGLGAKDYLNKKGISVEERNIEPSSGRFKFWNGLFLLGCIAFYAYRESQGNETWAGNIVRYLINFLTNL